jgi:hypothetical protein
MRLLRRLSLAGLCAALSMIGSPTDASPGSTIKIKVNLKLKVHVSDLSVASTPDGLNLQGVNNIPGLGLTNISGTLFVSQPDAKGHTTTSGTLTLHPGGGSTLDVSYTVTTKKNSESLQAHLVFNGGTGEFAGWKGHGNLFLEIQKTADGGADLLFTLDGVLKIKPTP